MHTRIKYCISQLDGHEEEADEPDTVNKEKTTDFEVGQSQECLMVLGTQILISNILALTNLLREEWNLIK